jgi:hypothetical protein
MNVVEILLLGILSAFWPTLLVVVLVALRTPHPARILVAFLIGGLATCIAVGTAVVRLLRQSGLIHGSRHTTDPVVNLVCGVLSLIAAYALHRYLASPFHRERRRRRESSEPPAWAERFIGRGAALAFGAGIVLNIVPGFVPIVAIKDIAELDVGAAESLAILTVFYVMMFAFVEIPLLGYLVSPAGTADAVRRFNAWLSANAGVLATAALAVAGVYFVLRGIVAVVP